MNYATSDGATRALSNRVIVRSSRSFIETLKQAGVSDTRAVVAQFTCEHRNAQSEDTLFCARVIELKAQFSLATPSRLA